MAHKLIVLILATGVGFIPATPPPHMGDRLCQASETYRNTHEQQCLFLGGGSSSQGGGGGGSQPGLIERVIHGLTGGLL